MEKKRGRNPFELPPAYTEVGQDPHMELQWKPFPVCMKLAIDKIEASCFKGKGQKKWNSRDAKPILEQFVWLYSKRLPQEKQVLNFSTTPRDFNPIRSLEIAEYMVRKICAFEEEREQRCLFTAFFSHVLNAGPSDEIVLYLLSVATQLAASFQASKFLRCCSGWMRDTGLDSNPVKYIVNDFIQGVLSAGSDEKYLTLPDYAPEFAASIVMCISRMYSGREKPPALWNYLCLWVERYPSVCFIPPQSALFDLFRWTMFDTAPEEPRLHVAVLSAVHRAGKGAALQVIPHVLQLIEEFRHNHSVYCDGNELKSLRQVDLIEKFRLENAQCPNADMHPVYQQHKLKRRLFKAQIRRLFQLIQMLVSSGCLEENEVHPIFAAYEGAFYFRFSFYMQLKNFYGIQEEFQVEASPRSRKAASKDKNTRARFAKSVIPSRNVGPDADKVDSDDEDYFERRRLLESLKQNNNLDSSAANGDNELMDIF